MLTCYPSHVLDSKEDSPEVADLHIDLPSEGSQSSKQPKGEGISLDSTNSSRISAEFVARARCSKTTRGGSALVAAVAVWCASVALFPSFASAQTGGCSRPARSLVQRFDELDCALNCGDGWKNETNDDEGRKLAWKESYLMMAYVAMYDATLDVYYLRKLVDHADSVLLNTDENRGVSDYANVSGPCWRDFFDADHDPNNIPDSYAC